MSEKIESENIKFRQKIKTILSEIVIEDKQFIKEFIKLINNLSDEIMNEEYGIIQQKDEDISKIIDLETKEKDQEISDLKELIANMQKEIDIKNKQLLNLQNIIHERQ